MGEIIVKILVELLSTIALVTKQIKQERPRKCVITTTMGHLTQHEAVKFVKKLLGDNEVEVVLQRLDRLTLEEARMTAVQTLGVVHGLVRNMGVFMDGESVLFGLAFIISRYHVSMTPGHTIVAHVCLGILLHFDESITCDSLKNLPLVKYAARH
jgi:hypothetical protein